MISDLRSVISVAGEEPAQAAHDEDIELQVTSPAEAKKGFVKLIKPDPTDPPPINWIESKATTHSTPASTLP
jgi:hypothetical protein